MLRPVSVGSHETVESGESETPIFQIELPARPENIALAREAVAEQASSLGMAGSNMSDLRTVVSEAFTNAVLYAYEDDAEGVIEVRLTADAYALCLTIRDFGVGLLPRPEEEVPSLNMGLPIIGALSTEFSLSTKRGQGTALTIYMPMLGAS